MKHLLTETDWSFIDNSHSVDDSFNCFFYVILKTVISKCVPLLKLKEPPFPVRYDNDLIASVRNKERSWQDYVKKGKVKDSDEYVHFSNTRRDFKKLQKTKYNEYLYNAENSIKDNPRRFWSFVKGKKEEGSIPATMSDSVSSSSNPTEIKSNALMYIKPF